MSSQEYKDLHSTIALLRKHLLPNKFDPLGTYKDRVFTGVVSFRVLSHAAIEEYLETRSVNIAVRASKAASRGVMNRTIACLLSFSDNNFGPPPDTLTAPQPSQAKVWPEKIDIHERANSTASSHVRYAKAENHGIREKNFLRLLLPIGLPTSSIDAVLMSELDSLGVQRGLFAHTSATLHIQSKPDPKAELDRIKNIMKLLSGLDRELDRLQNSIPASR